MMCYLYYMYIALHCNEVYISLIITTTKYVRREWATFTELQQHKGGHMVVEALQPVLDKVFQQLLLLHAKLANIFAAVVV